MEINVISLSLWFSQQNASPKLFYATSWDADCAFIFFFISAVLLYKALILILGKGKYL